MGAGKGLIPTGIHESEGLQEIEIAMITRWTYWMILSLLAACGPSSRDSALQNYLNERFGTRSGFASDFVFVITEDGCPVCDRRFADLLRERTECMNCLFIVRAQGSSFSLNGFLEGSPNTRFDDGSFKSLGLLEGSGVILLNERRIDSIIPLRIEEIDQQLSYVATLLGSESK
jgi:hypothetical protein